MDFWKIAPWLGRFIILAVALLYAMIGLRFVLDPQTALAHSGIAVASGRASPTPAPASAAFRFASR